MFSKYLKLSFVCIFCFAGFVSAATFDECKTLYNNSQYDKASSCFYKFLSTNQSNDVARFYYANSLFSQKRYNLAKIQYTQIIQNHPYSATAISAKKNLELTNEMLKTIKTSKTNDTGNYLSEITPVRWRSMPIKVWVQGGVYKTSAKRAFMEWQNKTQAVVSFTFVDKPNDAEIVVLFENDISKAAETGDALGVTSLSVVNNKYIKSAEMRIKTTTANGAVQSPTQIYTVVLHEVGHALGIKGHSSNKFDVMYPSDDNYRNVLSNRDINTVKELYKY